MNPRSGFVEETQFQKLIAHAKELWLRALVTTGYTFGFRKGELERLRVDQVILTDRTIRLNTGETKSKKGRIVPLGEDLFVLLQALVIGRKGSELVFFGSDGISPAAQIRKAWRKLCKAADMPTLLFHDLRRSAVRNMIRSPKDRRGSQNRTGKNWASFGHHRARKECNRATGSSIDNPSRLMK